MAFQFRLKSVLTLRERERDLQAQAVAICQANLENCLTRRNDLADARHAVIEQLRLMNDAAVCDVLQMIHRKRYAEQLADDWILAEVEIRRAETELEMRRDDLMNAIQSVRALEKLSERRFVDYRLAELSALARNQENS